MLQYCIIPCTVLHCGYLSHYSIKRSTPTSFSPRWRKERAPSTRLPIWVSKFPLISQSVTALYMGCSVALIWDTPVSDGKRIQLIPGASCVPPPVCHVTFRPGQGWDWEVLGFRGSDSSHWLTIYYKCDKSVWSQTAAVNYWNAIIILELMCNDLYGHFSW